MELAISALEAVDSALFLDTMKCIEVFPSWDKNTPQACKHVPLDYAVGI